MGKICLLLDCKITKLLPVSLLDVTLNNYFALNCVFILKKTEEKTIHIVMFSSRIMKGFSHFSHDQFWMNKDKITQAGFEHTGALPTELTSPILVVIFIIKRSLFKVSKYYQ